jgi:hypothetical protein
VSRFEPVLVAHLGHAAGGRRDLLGLDLVQLAELPLFVVVEVHDLVVELAELLGRLMKSASSGGASPTAMISLLAGGENVVVL